ncbi:MAG: hypothetical protein ABI939_12090, partial [Anaerolineaceae bacterium]
MQLTQSIPNSSKRTGRPGALATIIGGALVVAGALLPWLRVFAGLESFSGAHGLYGQALLGGGLAAVALGAIRGWRPTPSLRGSTALMGGALLALGGFALVQALAAVHSLDGMILPSLGPGTSVAV